MWVKAWVEQSQTGTIRDQTQLAPRLLYTVLSLQRRGNCGPEMGKGCLKSHKESSADLELEPTSSDSPWQFVPLHQGQKLSIFRRQVVMNNMENG